MVSSSRTIVTGTLSALPRTSHAVELSLNPGWRKGEASSSNAQSGGS